MMTPDFLPGDHFLGDHFLWGTHMKVPLPPPSGLVSGCPKIPSPISRVGGAGSSPCTQVFFPFRKAVWNRAVLCSHSTWLKNVRNVELYFPPPSLPAFSFLTLLSELVQMGVFYPVVWFFGPGGGGVRPSGCGRPAPGVCACVRSEQLSPPLSLCFPVACSMPRFKLKQAGEEENSLISEWRMRKRLAGGGGHASSREEAVIHYL